MRQAKDEAVCGMRKSIYMRRTADGARGMRMHYRGMRTSEQYGKLQGHGRWCPIILATRTVLRDAEKSTIPQYTSSAVYFSE